MKTLALQGGGTRGVMHAAILEKLNPRFDLIAGTSIGSIVGGCLAAGIPADRIGKFFTVAAPHVFHRPWWKSLFPVIRLFSSAKYSAAPLRAALIEMVGTRTLADCQAPFVATAVEMRTGRPAYFQTYGQSYSDSSEIVVGPDSGMLLVDAMLASSAAQLYFPGHHWGGYVFWDGGSTALTAPDMLALEEAKLFAPLPEIRLLSLGCGDPPWPYLGLDLTDPPLAVVLEATANIAYAMPEMVMVWLARLQLGANHFRLNPVIANHSLDDASPDALAAMRSAALSALGKAPLVKSVFG